jgi:short-subunit dehydrogenase
MNQRFQLKHSCVLITGASSGLGAEFARQLAPHAATLILVARRKGALEKLKDELLMRYPSLLVCVKNVDLSDANAREALATWIQENALPLNLLINNAGLGDLGDFGSAEWSRLASILDVNITALTHLTHLLLPVLRASAPSAILQIGSVAGFFPLPYNAVYAASKAYVKNFSRALSIEEEANGVFISLLSPGPTPTAFFEIASRPGEKIMATSRLPQLLMTSADEVVKVGLSGLVARRFSIIPNRNLRVAMRLCSMLPFTIFKKFIPR